jgi:hypothetical protein
MPFKSKAQQRYMFAAEARGELPRGTAERWAHHTRSIEALPERVKKRKKKAAAPLSWLEQLVRTALVCIHQKKQACYVPQRDIAPLGLHKEAYGPYVRNQAWLGRNPNFGGWGGVRPPRARPLPSSLGGQGGYDGYRGGGSPGGGFDQGGGGPGSGGGDFGTGVMDEPSGGASGAALAGANPRQLSLLDQQLRYRLALERDPARREATMQLLREVGFHRRGNSGGQRRPVQPDPTRAAWEAKYNEGNATQTELEKRYNDFYLPKAPKELDPRGTLGQVIAENPQAYTNFRDYSVGAAFGNPTRFPTLAQLKTAVNPQPVTPQEQTAFNQLQNSRPQLVAGLISAGFTPAMIAKGMKEITGKVSQESINFDNQAGVRPLNTLSEEEMGRLQAFRTDTSKAEALLARDPQLARITDPAERLRYMQSTLAGRVKGLDVEGLQKEEFWKTLSETDRQRFMEHLQWLPKDASGKQLTWSDFQREYRRRYRPRPTSPWDERFKPPAEGGAPGAGAPGGAQPGPGGSAGEGVFGGQGVGGGSFGDDFGGAKGPGQPEGIPPGHPHGQIVGPPAPANPAEGQGGPQEQTQPANPPANPPAGPPAGNAPGGATTGGTPPAQPKGKFMPPPTQAPPRMGQPSTKPPLPTPDPRQRLLPGQSQPIFPESTMKQPIFPESTMKQPIFGGSTMQQPGSTVSQEDWENFRQNVLRWQQGQQQP